MEAPMAQISLHAPPDTTSAPSAQNEASSHSFVAPLPQLSQPIPTADDDDDEWEYEYSTEETETFYLTLDLTTPSIPTSRPLTVSSRNGRAGFRAKWLNPGLGRRKHLLGQAPTLRVKDGEDGEVDDLDAEEDAPGETDHEYQPEEPEQTPGLSNKDNELKEHKVQILDLESDNPLVSYRDHIFTCQWTRNIGTELLFTGSENTEHLPTLRELDGGVALLGACTARITSQTATLVPIDKSKANGLEEEGDGPLVESISAAASDERRKQARFLERLMKVKKEKGEKDEVTVVAYKRLRWTGWIEMLNKRRNEEREDIRRKLRRAENDEVKEKLESRLKELDDEEKNMPVDGPPPEDDVPEDGAPATRQVKRRRKKRVPTSRTEPLPEGVKLRTGERAKPVRRRPRGEWKRYNVDGTIVPPVLEAPKVPGDEEGRTWRGWHEGREEIEDEKEGKGDTTLPANGEQGKDGRGGDGDGDATMADASGLPGPGSSVEGYETHGYETHGYETQYEGRQASSIAGHDFDHYDRSSPLKSSPLKARWDLDDHAHNADQSRPGPSRQQSFGQGIGFRDDTPPVLSRAGSGIGFRDDHATSAPVSVHGIGFRDGHAASAPGSVHGIGIRNDHASSVPGSNHGVGFRDDSQQHYFAGIGAAHDDAGAVAGGINEDGEQHAPPPGGWMGLLEGDDIPHLPEE